MNIEVEANVTEVIEVTDNDTGDKSYLVSTKDNNWEKITQDEYNNILRGKKND